MPRLLARQDFEPSCLSGGTWYSCGAGSRFVGCCTSDPCNSRGCSDGNLRAASFNASAWSDFPDAECDSGRFWTCASTDPPFLGCCKVDACQAEGNSGCPDDELTAAHLPNNDALASAYSPTGGPSSTATATSSPTGSSSSGSSSTSTAGIVGGVIGAVVVLLFVIGALLWRRRSKKKKAAAAAAAAANMNGDDGRAVSELAGADVRHGKGSPLAQHPPRYSSLSNGSPNAPQYAMELDGYPTKPHAQRTPSELGAGVETAPSELPGDDAAAVATHELEGSSPGTAFTGASAKSSPSSKKTAGATAAHSRGSSWSSFNERRAARRASAGTGNDGGAGGGGGGLGGGGGGGPRGLAIVGLHPHSQVHAGSRGSNNNEGGGGGGSASPRGSPSPRSPSFPAGGGDDAGSEHSGVSSLPSTPRSGAYGYGPGAGTTGGYSDVSRLSPTYPPPIREDVERGEEQGGRYRDRDDDDYDDYDDDETGGGGYGNRRR